MCKYVIVLIVSVCNKNGGVSRIAVYQVTHGPVFILFSGGLYDCIHIYPVTQIIKSI